MKTVYSGGEAEIVEKKSRFIATVRPVSSEEEAVAFIAEMKKKYWDARHNCSAFVIGDRQEMSRCSDDGEPAQTAGRPMLDVLLREDIHIIDKKEGRRLSVGTDYTGLGKLQYLVAQNGLTLIDTVYTEKVELLLMVPSEMQEQTEKEIIEATNGKADISWGEMVLYAMVEGKLQIF